ncbi:Autoinducer 2 import system permease protein LsrD [Ruegeria sp. THAF57]|uniref:ABC transporter permease n=1 Tax=Ruegeria sp. THAF57 TaxID=2744555 RepID=UPI0015DFD89E|nr:ABC transporter permease [Ruegeria sp. THAF57]CAD0186965.1 Autoinducer 2 import system permease protein LsrD [Ruegeria sp. THAF57]
MDSSMHNPAATPEKSGLSVAMARNPIDVAITVIAMLLFGMYLIGAPEVYLHFDIYRSFMSTLPYMGLLALGATFIVTLGEIDLSFPSVMGVAAWVFATVFTMTGSIPISFLACIGTGMICGALNGLLITRIGVPSIVATIGTMFLWRGLVNVLAQGKGIPLVEMRDSVFYDVLVGRLFGQIPMQFVWFCLIAILMIAIYKRHVFGSHVLFVGDNKSSAQMMGIRVYRTRMTCYILMGAMSGLSAVFLLSEVTYFWPTTGDGFLLPALAAVFIGGTSVFGGRGSMYGTFVGILIIGSLEAGIVAMGVQGFYTQLIYGLTITVAVSIYALVMKK